LQLGNDAALINATIIDNNTAATGLLFAAAAPQIGALGGVGNIVLPATSLTVGGNNVSSTYSGSLSGSGAFIKSGSGTLTLAGSNGYTGATTVSGGLLKITGTLAGTTSLTIANSATLYLAGGGLSVSGAITNNGIFKLSGTSSLAFTGGFTNNGVFDFINGFGSLPADFVNNGTVLDSSAVKVQEVTVTGTNLSLTIQSYRLHTYQLQRADSLIPPNWTDVGASQPGNDSTLTFTDVGGAIGPKYFYRIQVSP
jgi:autotransporter-associated beta strand protein